MKIGRACRIIEVAVGLLLLARVAPAFDGNVRDLVEPLLRARAEQPLGAVAAKAYVELSRPGAGPTPQPSVLIHLVPDSRAFAAELDAVKAGLRDSLDGYMRAVSRLEGSRVDYERALVAAGGGALVRSEVTDSKGVAQLADVPSGAWLMVAWREADHLTKHFKRSQQDQSHYPDVPTTATYSVVTYWRARLTVSPGQTAEVVLTDRNVWMTAPRQEGGASPGPGAPGTGSRKRR
jgi:hypothetical protein